MVVFLRCRWTRNNLTEVDCDVADAANILAKAGYTVSKITEDGTKDRIGETNRRRIDELEKKVARLERSQKDFVTGEKNVEGEGEVDKSSQATQTFSHDCDRRREKYRAERQAKLEAQMEAHKAFMERHEAEMERHKAETEAIEERCKKESEEFDRIMELLGADE